MGLSMECCLGKKLSRVNNGEWRYKFKCQWTGCDRVFGIPRSKITDHSGYCTPHHAEFSRNMISARRAMKAERLEAGMTATLKDVYNQLTCAAKQTKRSLTITLDQMERLTRIKECRYCGDSIPWFSTSAYFLDRLDNTLGYDIVNVTVCCSLCNLTRGSRYTPQEMLILGSTIRDIKESRKIKQELSAHNDFTANHVISSAYTQ